MVKFIVPEKGTFAISLPTLIKSLLAEAERGCPMTIIRSTFACSALAPCLCPCQKAGHRGGEAQSASVRTHKGRGKAKKGFHKKRVRTVKIF